MQLFLNESAQHRQPVCVGDTELIGIRAPAVAKEYLRACPRYRATSLHALPKLAYSLGLGAIFVKDEGERLGLGSFKALGGAYAVLRIVREIAEKRFSRSIAPEALLSADVKDIARAMTFVCATDGNHGRSVAAAARLIGSRAVIFVHAGVSEERVAALRSLGADIVRVGGDYDASIAEARRAATAEGWCEISDFSYESDERTPGLVIQGYTVLIDEALEQLAEQGSVLTHVFIQAGVGALAAAVAGYLSERFQKKRPMLIVVEPERAACLFESARAGKPVRIAALQSTIMAMLECRQPSAMAWRILERCADAFVTVPERAAIRAMKALAFPGAGDPALVSGESGAAGLAGLMTLTDNPMHRLTLQLDADSRVLLINTETATDIASYERLVGVHPQCVGSTAAGAPSQPTTPFRI